ncbi:MAG TPA: MarR family transcriptional regulator [Candidatus Limnocylindria bacterium]|nr:MarR family transcriptional regulator [Candidatus Limnocylindria bacterium]
MKGNLATRLNSATVHIGRALRKEAVPSPVAAEHRSALGVVYFAGPIRMGALAAAERVGAPAMTKTVAILEREGLVRREVDRSDERAVLIRATRKGAARVREGRDERVRRIDRALRRMTPGARARMAAAVGDLERLIDVLELENRAAARAAMPSLSPRRPRSDPPT